MGLDAEEEEIRILKERAQEKADLKTKLQAELLVEEGVEMRLQALALEREEEKDNAKKTAAIAAAAAATTVVVGAGATVAVLEAQKRKEEKELDAYIRSKNK